jgi:hypothetical protein
MEQTFLAVYERIRAAVLDEVDLTAPAPEILRSVVRRSAAYGSAHREEIRTLNQIAQNLRTPAGELRFTLADNEEFYRGSEELYRRGQREGHFRRFDTRVMAVTYQAAMDSMFAYAEAYPGIDLATYADALADLLLSAMSRPGRARPAARRSLTTEHHRE